MSNRLERFAMAVGLNGCAFVEVEPLALKEQMHMGVSKILEGSERGDACDNLIGVKSGIGGGEEKEVGDAELMEGKKLRIDVCDNVLILGLIKIGDWGLSHFRGPVWLCFLCMVLLSCWSRSFHSRKVCRVCQSF